MSESRLEVSALSDMAISYYLRKKAHVNPDFDYQDEYDAIASDPDKLTKIVAEYKKYAQFAD